MNSEKVLLGTLDPTYSLLPAENRVLPQAPDIRAYLRLSYLFVGDPVIPRTFFIHGLANPLYELYATSIDGRAEIRDFLTSGVVRVSGHNHSDFRSFSGHYNVTKDEHHPLLVPDDEHLEYAKFSTTACLQTSQSFSFGRTSRPLLRISDLCFGIAFSG